MGNKIVSILLILVNLNILRVFFKIILEYGIDLLLMIIILSHNFSLYFVKLAWNKHFKDSIIIFILNIVLTIYLLYYSILMEFQFY